jgi:DNA-binding NarL/FixJ family response regulator
MRVNRLLLGDDHDIVVEGLRRILDQPEFEIVGVVSDGRSLLRAAEELQPDVIIVDITMPLLNGIEAVRQIRKTNRKVIIIFLTMHSEVIFATEAIAAGASGYVLKNSAAEELVTAIRETLRGHTYITSSLTEAVNKGLSARSNSWRSPLDKLTLRQREVLQLLAEGHQVKEIAVRLNVSPRTVEFHKYRIMDQLNLHSVAELSRYAVSCGIVS